MQHERNDTTVYFRGRRVTARRVDRLPNGLWRADLPGGLVALYNADPRDNLAAEQVA